MSNAGHNPMVVSANPAKNKMTPAVSPMAIRWDQGNKDALSCPQ
jgi:hypothetical protein